MKILVADDDPVSRAILASSLGEFGCEAVEVEDGTAAWEVLQRPDAPRLAILDWMMPGLDGPEVCKLVRAREMDLPPYLIMLTSRDGKGDLLEALEAGADEFVAKPFDPGELRARIAVGRRMLALQGALVDHVHRLQEALDQVRTLQGIVPICSYCKKIRNDERFWEQLELYITEHTGATFSHGVCPECYETRVRPELDELKREAGPTFRS